MGQTKNLSVLLCLAFVGLFALHASAIDQSPGVDKVDARELIVEKVATVYTSQLGVRELTGHNDGVEVEKYLATTKLTKGNAWCAAFITWCFITADVPAINSAWSPNWFPPDKTIYLKGGTNNKTPKRADVGGLYFSNLKRIAHVFFIDSWPPGEYTITVEGNTNDAGSREGDGVYRKRRLKRNIDKVSRWV